MVFYNFDHAICKCKLSLNKNFSRQLKKKIEANEESFKARKKEERIRNKPARANVGSEAGSNSANGVPQTER